MSNNAVNTYLAVQALRPQLPELIGPDEWPAVAAELDRLDAEWVAAGDDGTRRRLAGRYRDVLAPWPVAYERVRASLDGMSAYATALRRLALRAEEAGEHEAAAALRDEAEQPRMILERGVGAKAYSVKLRNLDVRFWKMSGLAAGVLGAVAAAVASTDGALTLTIAILAAVAGTEALVKEITVDDASVFLGLIDTGGEARQAALPDIMAATNAARAAQPGYLQPMDEAAVKQSLDNLYRLHSIKPVEGATDVWQVIEDYGRV